MFKRVGLVVAFLVLSFSLSFASTYYIRPDGGTAGQCDGTVDAPYSKDANGKCAWAHPFWALDSKGHWKIKGGDTLIIYPGSYMIGYGAPNTDWCNTNWPWSCRLPALPSGPDKTHPTRLLGADWESGCKQAPELWGTERVQSVLSLEGAKNVMVACLEITDHEACTEMHALSQAACKRDAYPFGKWGKYGIFAPDAQNITLKDLNIHGLANRGIVAYRIKDWDVTNVRIAANGWSGWEGDAGPGQDSANSGTIHFKRVTIEWNGCVEDYPNEEAHKWCWSGYGDGLGTGATSGKWVIEDSVVRYNTSDGLDLLYLKLPGAGPVIIKRSQFYGNAGNQVKVRSSLRLENSIVVGSCSFFKGKDFTYKVDHCRAGGDAVAFSPTVAAENVIVNNTILGQGNVLLMVANDRAPEGVTIKIYNNILYGNGNFFNGGKTGAIWSMYPEKLKAFWAHNILYNVKTLALDKSNLFVDPKLKKPSLFDFDLTLQADSPAIDAGLPVGYDGVVPAVDITGHPRNVGRGVDVGAYEYSSPSVTNGSTFAAHEESNFDNASDMPNDFDASNNSSNNDFGSEDPNEMYEKGFQDGINYCKTNPEKCGIMISANDNCAYIENDFINIPCIKTENGTYSANLRRVLDSPVELYVLESIY